MVHLQLPYRNVLQRDLRLQRGLDLRHAPVDQLLVQEVNPANAKRNAGYGSNKLSLPGVQAAPPDARSN